MKTMTEINAHHDRLLTEFVARYGGCVTSADAECQIEAMANNGPPDPALLCAMLFPRIRQHMDGIDLEDLPGMEEIDSLDVFEEAEQVLAHSTKMEKVFPLGCGPDFGPDEYADVFGREEALPGRPIHRWDIGSDGRGYLAIVEQGTDQDCSILRWYRTAWADAPSYLDAIGRQRTRVVRRGRLLRGIDITGVSGAGHVADLEELSNGRVVVAWRGETPSVTVHKSMGGVERVHLHGGATRVEWT